MVGKKQKIQAGINLLVLIAFISMGMAGILPVSASSVSFVPASNGFQWYPAISGNRIVWSDNRNGSMDICLYDLSTQHDAMISSGPSDQYMPKIYGDRIVWMDKRNMVGSTEKWDIYLYDLQKGEEIPICTSPGSHKLPSIWADRIVWQDERNGNSDIYLYNISTGKERYVTTAKGNQMFPSIDGDRVVWLDARENTNFTDIYYYDLTLEREFPVWVHNPNRPAAAGVPAIFGDSIVWDVNWDDGSADLYLYHIATGQTSILVRESGSEVNRSSIYRVAISGNWVAYTLYKDGIRVVKVFDLSTGQAYLPVASQLGQDSPAVYGNTLVWQDKGSSKDKIAFTQLVPGKAPTAPFYDIEDHWSAPWVESLASARLVNGLEDGTFRPDSHLTRAQFAQLLTNAFTSGATDTGTAPVFPDVDPSSWYEKVVREASANGWMIGFDDGLFHPDDPLTKAQMVAVLDRAAQLKEITGVPPFSDIAGHWAERYIETFFLTQPPLLDPRYDRFLCPSGQFGPDQPITRGQASMLLASALRLPLANQTVTPTHASTGTHTTTGTPSSTWTPTSIATP